MDSKLFFGLLGLAALTGTSEVHAYKFLCNGMDASGNVSGIVCAREATTTQGEEGPGKLLIFLD